MTREEENRKLAEWLEPFESLPYDEHLEAEYGLADVSPKGGWVCDWIPLQTPGAFGLGWKPRDFYSNEEANAILLDELPFPMLQKRLLPESVTAVWECELDVVVVDPEGPPVAAMTVQNADRKTAICLAALKLAGGE